MLFNSLTFLLFFGVVLAIHHLPISWRARKTSLLISSYLFYAAWNPPFVALLWLSTLVDWFVARRMANTEGLNRRRGLLGISLLVNLGMLSYFKYGGFLLENFQHFAASIGLAYSPPEFSVVLPVGISFYTFQTLSYTIDVFRGELEPSDSFLDFALFVTFFPQLVAGPIVRAGVFLPQCKSPKRATADQMGWGLTLLAIGLVEKAVLADNFMAPVSDTVFGRPFDVGQLDVWIGMSAFSAQVFFDFSGYSLCAIGAALCLGFVIPDNFRFPLGSIGFSELWRRWHVSLGTWLRDYLYIPLGGSAKGLRRTGLNVMIVMLLAGLWHGAGWGFIAWGAIVGGYLIGERFLGRAFKRLQLRSFALGRAFLVGLTYFLFCFSLLPFRSPDLGSATAMMKALFVGGPNLVELGSLNVLIVGVTTLTLVVSHRLMRNSSLEALFGRLPWWGRSLVTVGLLLLLVFVPRNDRAFFYFQF